MQGENLSSQGFRLEAEAEAKEAASHDLKDILFVELSTCSTRASPTKEEEKVHIDHGRLICSEDC